MKIIRRIWIGALAVISVLFVGFFALQWFGADSSGPEISGGHRPISVSVKEGEKALLKGLTATDHKDGDITSSLIVEKISKFYEKNKRTVTYVAFDSDSNITKLDRVLMYTDYTSPTFGINSSLRFRAGEKIDLLSGVTASDCLDGDISNNIKVTMEKETDDLTVGIYDIEYEVTNSAGDTVKLPLKLEIYEPYDNEVELNLEKYLVYYDGEEIDYTSFLKNVKKGNETYPFEGTKEAKELPKEDAGKILPKYRVRISSEVDTKKPGVYPVYFYYSRAYNTYSSEAKEVLYVVVK